MLFKKKDKAGPQDIEKAFEMCYDFAWPIVKEYENSKRSKFELLVAMYIVSDYAAISSIKERKDVSDRVLSVINNILKKDLNIEVFDERCKLYGEVIRGKALRCDWALGNSEQYYENAITKTVALLGDLLYNPDLADNYDSSPVLIMGVTKVLEFNTAVISRLLNVFVNLFNVIYDL